MTGIILVKFEHGSDKKGPSGIVVLFFAFQRDMYHVCCHDNSCANGLPTSCEAVYVIANAYVNDLYYLYSLCNGNHIKLTTTRNVLEILLKTSL